MTILEQHIDFEQSAQQVAANKTLKYLPEEVDWFLNKALDRFIKLKLKPKVDERGTPTGGFEVSQLDADAIRTLIVSSRDLVPYIDQDNRRYRCFLPPDYSYLLSDWSYTKLLCGEVIEPTNETMYITALRQEQSSKSAPPLYESLNIQLGGQQVNIPADLPYGNSFAGYNEKTEISFLRPIIAKQGNYYWERFDDLYYPSYYISATTSSINSAAPSSIMIDGNTTNVTKIKNYPVRRHIADGKYYDNRLSATDNISGMNSTEYIKASYYSPISELSNGILYVYNDESYIVSNVGISYVRKPQPMSLYLNTDCELPEEFHRTIVDLAVEYVKGTLENMPGYQQKVADNDKRVVI